MLLDTTFFVDLEYELTRSAPGPCAAFLAAHRHDPKHVSVITLGEFAIGASSTTATLRFFHGYRRIALGRDLAIFGGQLQASLPLTLGENDLWIAATAIAYRWPLVTHDRVFREVPGLKVMDY